MEIKVRGDVVLFELLEIKTDSKLIVQTSTDDMEKFIIKVKYVGDTVIGINVGDEILLKSDKFTTVKVDGDILGMITSHGVLAIVEDNNVETYTGKETHVRMTSRYESIPNNTTSTMDVVKNNGGVLLPGKDFDF